MRWLFIFLLCVFPVTAEEVTGIVKNVVDGDTFELKNGIFVRLLSINTPEISGPHRHAEPGGKEASVYAKTLLSNQRVKLVTYDRKYDKYGRLLADAYLEDGRWVNLEFIKAGVAHIYTFPDNRRDVSALLAAETKARQEKKGLWKYPRWNIKNGQKCCEKEDLARFQVIEGTIYDVTTHKGMIYLNFGENWRTDFTVEINRKAQELFGKNWNFEGLRGKEVQVRGFVKPVNGALISLTHPEQLVVLP